MSVEIEFDDRLPPRDRVDPSLELDVAQFRLRDVRGELYDLDRAACEVEDRIVSRLKPYVVTASGEASVFPSSELATSQPVPEGSLFRCLREGRVAEHPVVLAPDFLQ
jgi:hypothetical protein